MGTCIICGEDKLLIDDICETCHMDLFRQDFLTPTVQPDPAMENNEIAEFWMSYTDDQGFQVIDHPTYDLIVEGAKIFERRASQIHSDSTKPYDPLINIVVVHDGPPLGDQLAAQIDQAAFDWLVNTGRWVLPDERVDHD